MLCCVRAPSRLRGGRRVREQPAVHDRGAPFAGVPLGAGPRARAGRARAPLLPLPEPERRRPCPPGGLGAGLRTVRAGDAHRPARLRRPPRALEPPRAARRRELPSHLRPRHRPLRHLHAGARPERADERGPRAPDAAGDAPAVSARSVSVPRRDLGQRRVGLRSGGPGGAVGRARRDGARPRRADHPLRLRLAVPDPHRARRPRPGARAGHARGRRSPDGLRAPEPRPLPPGSGGVARHHLDAKVPGRGRLPGGDALRPSPPPEHAPDALLRRRRHRGAVLRCCGHPGHLGRAAGGPGARRSLGAPRRLTGGGGARGGRGEQQPQLPRTTVSAPLRHRHPRGLRRHGGRRGRAAGHVPRRRLRRGARRLPEHRARLPARDGARLAPRGGADARRVEQSVRRPPHLRSRAGGIRPGPGEQDAARLQRGPTALAAHPFRSGPAAGDARLHHLGRRAALAHRRLSLPWRERRATTIGTQQPLGRVGRAAAQASPGPSRPPRAGGTGASRARSSDAGGGDHVRQHPELSARAPAGGRRGAHLRRYRDAGPPRAARRGSGAAAVPGLGGGRGGRAALVAVRRLPGAHRRAGGDDGGVAGVPVVLRRGCRDASGAPHRALQGKPAGAAGHPLRPRARPGAAGGAVPAQERARLRDAGERRSPARGRRRAAPGDRPRGGAAAAVVERARTTAGRRRGGSWTATSGAAPRAARRGGGGDERRFWRCSASGPSRSHGPGPRS